MSARVTVPECALAVIDGERRALRAIRCIEDRIALSSDHLLHELQDVLAMDAVNLKVTPRLRGFARTLTKRLEGGQ